MRLKPPFDRISVEPDKMGGQPCIREMRITVRRVVELLAEYDDRGELLKDYPDLEAGDLRQALRRGCTRLEPSSKKASGPATAP
jgi:uncharacterized protein (DUF433 family)